MSGVAARCHAAGGVVLAGTDLAPLPGFGLPDELALLVEAGLSPAAALRAATLDAARVFLADIRNVAKVRAVVTNGRLLDRAALDRLLASGDRAADFGTTGRP
jgi:hypothetical protein